MSSSSSQLSRDPKFIPIAVWLQDPKDAKQYKSMGVNVYVGLWGGPTEKQLAQLKKTGMKVICDQNAVGLKHRRDPLIVGWMHGDEPDNAQSIAGGWPDLRNAKVELSINGERYGQYGPPVPPYQIIGDYHRIKAADPTRPVYLNLGCAVAWDNYFGRGVRSRHPEDYAEYAKGCDIVSYDIYPTNGTHPEVAGNLWLVAHGVSRLREWTNCQKPVWCWIECTKMGEGGARPTIAQVRSEVWMALIHGAAGFGYFCHVFHPKTVGAGCLSDPEMVAGMRAVNLEVLSLAPVLNSPTVEKGAAVTSSNADVPVKVMVKKYRNETYLFAVAMRPGKTKASFTLKGVRAAAETEVIGEDRCRSLNNGGFFDTFSNYATHLYRIKK
jgi:hypothetical protein